MIKIFCILFIFLLLKISPVNAGYETDFIEHNIELINETFSKISSTRNERMKLLLNQQIVKKVEKILELNDSFKYDFSNLENIVVLTSQDKKLRIYNWNIPMLDGTHKYFGYLQYKSEKDNIKVYTLNDMSDHYNDEGRSFTSHKEWFGALYYEIVTKTWNRQTYYTLIGWDGGDFLINRKVIEVLQFTRRDLPQFGNRKIVVNNERVDRLIFEYTSRAAMLIRYNEKQDLIVMDHLSPPDTRYQGLRQYYGPDMSYDALEFVAGRWIYISDIDPNIAINYKRDRRTEAMRRQRDIRQDR